MCWLQIDPKDEDKISLWEKVAKTGGKTCGKHQIPLKTLMKRFPLAVGSLCLLSAHKVRGKVEPELKQTAKCRRTPKINQIKFSFFLLSVLLQYFHPDPEPWQRLRPVVAVITYLLALSEPLQATLTVHAAVAQTHEPYQSYFKPYSSSSK